jgi:hypothetical protein
MRLGVCQGEDVGVSSVAEPRRLRWRCLHTFHRAWRVSQKHIQGSLGPRKGLLGWAGS